MYVIQLKTASNFIDFDQSLLREFGNTLYTVQKFIGLFIFNNCKASRNDGFQINTKGM